MRVSKAAIQRVMASSPLPQWLPQARHKMDAPNWETASRIVVLHSNGGEGIIGAETRGDARSSLTPGRPSGTFMAARASRSCILHAKPLTSLVLKAKLGGVAPESEAFRDRSKLSRRLGLEEIADRLISI